MANSVAIIAALKQSPRGQLVYDRQGSSPITRNPIYIEAASPKGSFLKSAEVPKEMPPLAGSLADVSSVLEDVSNELSNNSLRRVASVIERLEEKNKMNDEIMEEALEEEEVEDCSKVVNLSFNSPNIVSTPIPPEEIVKNPMSPTIDEITIVVGQELLKMEADRKYKVQLRIKERKEKYLREQELQKIQKMKDVEKVQKTIEYDLAQMQAKEKEAEALIASRVEQHDDVTLMARKAREAQIAADIQKAKEYEAAKAARQKQTRLDKFSSEANQIKNLSEKLQSFGEVFKVLDFSTIDSILQNIGLSSSCLWDFPDFLQKISNNYENVENSMVVLDSLKMPLVDLINEAAQIQVAKDAEDERLKAEEEKQLRLKQEEAEAAAAAAAQAKLLAEKSEEKPPEPSLAKQIPAGELIEISPLNNDHLKAVIEFRDKYTAELQQMNVAKSFKFTCQKAVTTPLNAISDVTSDHLKDKLSKLIGIINGQQVQATETTIFQATTQSELIYTKNLLAKKLISHGEDVVAAKPKNAFAVGSLIVTIWSKNPDFGQVLLAYLYEACPFLAPKNPQRLPNDSDAEYFRKLGFKIFDGTIEDNTMYLKRLSGLTRMYAAITISRLPGTDATSVQHPHGLGHIWRVLSSTMNLMPINDITATVIYDLLSVTGAFMFEKYGQAFHKLLETLAQQYFPKIAQVTEEGCGGPVARLESILQKAITNKAIEKPNGLLRADFL